MSYFKVESSLTADASDINDNFYHLCQGSISPRDETDDSFGSVDLTNNLGSSVATWNNSYYKDVDIASSISTNNRLWTLIAEVTLSATASSIEFTGLNGDNVEEYNIFGRIFEPTYATFQTSDEECTFNGDSGTNYTHLYTRALDANVFSVLATSTSIKCSVTWSGTNTSAIVSFKLNIHSKTGKPRSVIGKYCGRVNGKYIGTVGDGSGTWNNTSDTMTSIKIIPNFATGHMFPGTNIQLWGRK